MLFDFYGAILTERQQKVFELYHEEDLSLGEIAQQLQISRQGVYDLVHRAERSLREMEDKLGLIRRYREEQEIVAIVEEQLRESLDLMGDQPGSEQIRRALSYLSKLK